MPRTWSPAGYKYPLYKPDEAPVELSDQVIESLFRQALVNNYPGEPYLEVLRRFTRLIEAELAA